MARRHGTVRRQRHGGRGLARDHPVKSGIIERGRKDGIASHLIETGQKITDRGNEAVSVHDLDGINTPGVTIDEIGARERQLAKPGIPRLSAIGGIGITGEEMTLVEQGIGRAAKKPSHPRHGIGNIRSQGVGRGSTRVGRARTPCIRGIEDQDQIGIRDVTTVIPDVSDDGGSLGTGQIDTHAARGHIGGVDADAETRRGRLPGRRIGRLTSRHGHDLHAHDHEAVIEHPHHQDEEDGQDESELNESLAFAPAAR